MIEPELLEHLRVARRFVARAFYQAQGGIAARILSRRQEPIALEFFQAALHTAQALRSSIFPAATAYRWVFGESDGLPGLVIDRYGAVAVAQTQCAFYARHAELLAEAGELSAPCEVTTVEDARSASREP